MKFTIQTHFNYPCGLNVGLDCILAFSEIFGGEGNCCHSEFISESQKTLWKNRHFARIFKILKPVQDDKNSAKVVKQVQGDAVGIYGGVV